MSGRCCRSAAPAPCLANQAVPVGARWRGATRQPGTDGRTTAPHRNAAKEAPCAPAPCCP
jgi:hypothetical protein